MTIDIDERYPIKECIVCGAKFRAYRPNFLTCSTECSNEHRRQKCAEYQRSTRAKKIKSDTLEEKIEIAASIGITYGQLQVLETWEKLRGTEDGIL